MTKKLKPVSPKVVTRRINRVLSRQGKALHKCRDDSRVVVTLGGYYITDLSTAAIVTTRVDLDMLADAVGVLRLDEYLCWSEEEGKEVTV